MRRGAARDRERPAKPPVPAPPVVSGMTTDAATLDTPRPAPAARLRFAWTLAANALVLLVMWIPAMLDLGRSHTVAAFQRWARPWSRVTLALIGIRTETAVAPESAAFASGTAGPVVFVANHRAMLDIPALLVGIEAPFLFVARAGLARLPLIGPVLRASVCVFLDRSAPGGADAALDAAEARLRAGESVLFFPEGTRRAGALGPFYAGAFRLAQRAGVPVVPIALSDTSALVDERAHAAYGGVVSLRVGPPLAPTGSPEALAEAARDAVARMLD